MGLMDKLFGGSQQSDGAATNYDGNHSISKDAALKATDALVPTPTNAKFTSIRTAPVVPEARYFNKQEEAALGRLAEQTTELAKTTKKAYRHLRTIDTNDAQVHGHHQRYNRTLARNEVHKLKENAKTVETLHGLRPDYAKLGLRVDAAENNATARIAAIKQTYGVTNG